MAATTITSLQQPQPSPSRHLAETTGGVGHGPNQHYGSTTSDSTSSASTSPITSTTGSPVAQQQPQQKCQTTGKNNGAGGGGGSIRNSTGNNRLSMMMMIRPGQSQPITTSQQQNSHQQPLGVHHRRSQSQIQTSSNNNNNNSSNNSTTIMANNNNNNNGGSKSNEISKIRLNVFCAKNLVKRDFFSLPDPFCKISVDNNSNGAVAGSVVSLNQCHTTESCKDTLSPKWNKNYDLYLTKNDSLTISIWNQKKIHKKHGAGFLGCVKIMPSLLHSLKDAGYQRLDLHKLREEDADIIKGQIVISVVSRDANNNNPNTNNGSSRNGTLNAAAVHRNAAVMMQDGNSNNGHHHRTDTIRARSYVEGLDDLPDGWTECRTSNGRVYYMNHVSRTTQWERPTLPAALSVSNHPNISTPSRPASSRSSGHHSSNSSRHLHLHVHQHNNGNSTHHHHHQTQGSVDSTTSVGSCNSAPPTSSVSQSQSQSRNNHQRRSTRHRNYLARNQLHEAVLSELTNQQQRCSGTNPNEIENASNSSILMPVGYEMRTTSQGQVYFYHSESGNSTWLDPRVPRELLNMDINLDELVGPLGCGWEVRHASGGRRYYVDHMNRTTQFTDPRLITHSAMIMNILRSLNKNQTHSQNGGGQHLVVNENNNNIVNVKCSNKRSSTTGDNLQVLKNGISSLPASQQQKRRNLVQKMSLLRQELQAFQPQSGHCRIEVSRDDIFEDSYRVILKLRPKDLRKRLMIKFKDEEGLDYGGIAREWLYLLSHEMLNPYYGLFQYTRDDIYTLQINPDSSINPDHLSYFHFVGRVIGIAVFHGHYIDGGFTLPFYKMLLNKPITLEDIESVDPELYRSLRWMLDNDITNVVDMTFSVNHDSFGQIQVKELKPNGKDIVVTEKNKKEYVQLYVNFRFTHGIEQQFRALQKGFFELVSQHLLGNFDEKELELVIGGLGKIDLTDWKQHTRLKHCTSDSNIVQWFWRAVDSFSEERRARLLQFVTGSSRVPLQGFKALQGSTGAAGPRLFTIHLIDADTKNLPKAHTCFNRIDIPPYETYEKLLEKLTQAIEETCGFAVE